MDRWCKDFDNWAICDTMCFNLFDRSPHAWAKVTQWSKRRGEFEKRTAFALLWSLSMHDKRADDKQFVRSLALIERAADDERNFVKKAVNMALRAIGKRNRALRYRRPRDGPAACRVGGRHGALDRARRAQGARRGGECARFHREARHRAVLPRPERRAGAARAEAAAVLPRHRRDRQLHRQPGAADQRRASRTSIAPSRQGSTSST